MKLFYFFALALFLFIGYRTYSQFKDIKATEKLIVLNESKSLSTFVTAFRQTYQDAFIDNNISINNKTIHLLPVLTIGEISKRFSKNVHGDIEVRTVSDRPRNIENMANTFELEKIEYFKKNPKVEDTFTLNEHAYNYTKPIYIKESCLKCHGKREEAIPSISNKYASAYDYSVGDVRGLLNIKINKLNLFSNLYQDFITNLVGTIFLYVAFLFIIYFFAKKIRKREEEYTHQLEIDVLHKTQEIQKQKDILHIQAYYDTLTNLPNRILFHDKLKQVITISKQNDLQFALFFIDLDYFKEINDSLGHHIGDKVLIEVARRLSLEIREVDVLARLGGDEFTIIFEELQEMDDLLVLAQSIQQRLSKPIYIKEHTFYVSCSIGISIYPQDSDDAYNLIKYADVAMYKAKEEGRNTTQFYSSEMTELTLNKMIMKTNLRKALKNEEFRLCYQAQVDVTNNKIIGMEALIRWEHPIDGMIFPDAFMDIVDEMGMIVEMDEWVMKTAMKQFVSWYDMGLNPGILALNLSTRQLKNDNYIEVLNSMLIETKFNPQWLELEITEGKVMKKIKESIRNLHQISNLGINIAIDDFGTGYSSLAYLKRLPVNKIKIDKSFVQGITTSKDDEAIVKATIALSKSLGLSIIAEGVETKEQLDFLVKYGCHYVQGYYFYRPVPKEKVEEVLAEDNNKL